MLPRVVNPAKTLLQEPVFPDIHLPSSSVLPIEKLETFALYPSWPEVQPYKVIDLLNAQRYRSYSGTIPPPFAYVDEATQIVLDVYNGLMKKTNAPSLYARADSTADSPPGIAIVADHTQSHRSSRLELECYCILLFLVCVQNSIILYRYELIKPAYTKPPGALNSTDWTYENNSIELDLCNPPSWQVWASHALRRAMENSTDHVLLTDLHTDILLRFEPREVNAIPALYSIGAEGETFRVSFARLLMARSLSTKQIREPVFPSLSRSFIRQGALNDLALPLPSTEVNLATRGSFGDFDVYTMQKHYNHYLAFRKWKSHIDQWGIDENIGAGTRLKGIVNGFLASNVPLRSVFVPPELPPMTSRKIQDELRPRCTALDAVLVDTFEIEITRFIRGGPRHWSQAAFGRVVRPSSESDLPSEALPEVFIKLYDERFFRTPPWWTEELEDPEEAFMMPGPLAYYNTAVELVRREEAAYYSLRHAQGSFVPHCYGFHQVVFLWCSWEGGWKTYGMITEIIPGQHVDMITPGLDISQIRELIINMRHAFRILRYADINQTDWNHGQVLVMRTNGHIVPVLVDFAFCLQSEPGFDVDKTMDWVSARDILEGGGVPRPILDELWEPADDVEW